MGRNDKEKQRRGSRSSSRPAIRSESEYPKEWSDWMWSEEHQGSYRAREIAADEYEYDYNRPTASSSEHVEEAAISVPSVQQLPQLQQIPETDDSRQDNYRLAANITQGMENVNIGSRGMALSTPPTVNIRTRRPQKNEEKFDSNYKVHHQREFKVGRVLKVLWSEPQGSDKISGGTVSSKREYKGEVLYAKVRRFVIIVAKKGHCICLPIMTYGGQGTLKPGVHVDHHAVIYTSAEPYLLPGEVSITRTPIKVNYDSPRHKLDVASRLNYAKVYTIECNVKVWFIGKVHKDSEWYLAADYNRTHPPIELGQRPSSYREGQSGPAYSSYGGAQVSSYNPGHPPQHTQFPQYDTHPQHSHYTPATFNPSAPPVYPASQLYGASGHPENTNPAPYVQVQSNLYGNQTPYQQPGFQPATQQPVPHSELPGLQTQDQDRQDDIYEDEP